MVVAQVDMFVGIEAGDVEGEGVGMVVSGPSKVAADGCHGSVSL